MPGKYKPSCQVLSHPWKGRCPMSHHLVGVSSFHPLLSVLLAQASSGIGGRWLPNSRKKRQRCRSLVVLTQTLIQSGVLDPPLPELLIPEPSQISLILDFLSCQFISPLFSVFYHTSFHSLLSLTAFLPHQSFAFIDLFGGSFNDFPHFH